MCSQPPSSKTLIATPETDADIVRNAQSVLARVHKVLADGNTELSLDDGWSKLTLVLMSTQKP